MASWFERNAAHCLTVGDGIAEAISSSVQHARLLTTARCSHRSCRAAGCTPSATPCRSLRRANPGLRAGSAPSPVRCPRSMPALDSARAFSSSGTPITSISGACLAWIDRPDGVNNARSSVPQPRPAQSGSRSARALPKPGPDQCWLGGRAARRRQSRRRSRDAIDQRRAACLCEIASPRTEPLRSCALRLRRDDRRVP